MTQPNRMIAALIEQIREDLPAPVLVAFFADMFADIIEKPQAEDVLMTHSLTCSQLVAVGAFWQHPTLYQAVTGEVIGRLLADVYGTPTNMLATTEADILAVATALQDHITEAIPLSVVLLDQKFPALALDLDAAVAALAKVDEGYKIMRDMIQSIVNQEAAEGAESTPLLGAGSSIIHKAPPTMQ